MRIRWTLRNLLNLLEIFGIKFDTEQNGIDYAQFNTSYDEGVDKEGKVQWNGDDGTLEFGMIGSEVVLQVGQEHIVRVYNNSGDAIANGSVVYIDSAGDRKPRIKLADADNTNSIPEAVVVGLATELIPNETQGYICSAGLVRGLNTNALTEGDPVWLSTTPGAFTATKPTAPNRGIFIGHCMYKHNNQGIILVSINPVPPLLGLSDVLSAAPSDGDVLMWSAANSRFELTQLP